MLNAGVREFDRRRSHASERRQGLRLLTGLPSCFARGIHILDRAPQHSDSHVVRRPSPSPPARSTSREAWRVRVRVRRFRTTSISRLAHRELGKGVFERDGSALTTARTSDSNLRHVSMSSAACPERRPVHEVA